MDIRTKLLCYCIVTSCLFISIEGTCTIVDRLSNCAYTVECETYAGSVSNPGCNGSPNVTFILRNSQFQTLTHGVFSSTNFDSRVRSFKALSNKWQILEKYALKYYRNAFSVDLSQNEIEIINEGTFLDLINMNYLNLSYNNIEILYEKSLQIADFTSSALNILDLSNNRLMSLGSNIFSYFQRLTELHLQNNNIQTLTDASFFNLKTLKFLFLQNNQISVVNMSLAPLNELVYLDMSRNSLNKLLGFEMSRLISLENLNISHNKIETVDYNCFSQAYNLQILDLSYNVIYSTLEKVMFINNHHLMSLKLNHNNITTISDSVFQFTDLIYFNIQYNNLSGHITNNTFRGLRNIIYLNITNQHIEEIEKNAFSDMKQLQFLNFSHNVIEQIHNSSFVNTTSLSTLDLSYNQIKYIYFFKTLNGNLREVYINNNDIMHIPEKLFNTHGNITKLDISANKIIQIAQNSLPLNNLQYLYLENNLLNGTVVQNVYSPAQYLRNLDLSNFKIENIDELAFTNLTLVANFNLSHNNIHFIHPNNFIGLMNMYILDLSYNNLVQLELNICLNSLLAINLSYNNFNSIPHIFGNNSKLQQLMMSHNKINKLTDAIFNNLTKLELLHLSHNHLAEFNNQFTNNLENLYDLSLASNEIGEMINISYFPQLQNVNISNNYIKTINTSHFEHSYTLQVLDLSINKIKYIQPGTFQHLSLLMFLDLSSNFLSDIRFGSFRGLNKTYIINLANNKLNFINFQVFHECFELKKLLIDYNNITTIDIEKLTFAVPKIKFLSLGGNPIACEEIVRNIRKDTPAKYFEVTSIHKVFNVDNVHGIQCGIKNSNDSVHDVNTSDSKNITKSEPTATILYTWCGILSLILLGGICFYIYKRHVIKIKMNNDTRMQFQNSSDATNSECYSDLLS